MPGIARQFEPQITRTGGAPSQYRFTARCSGCHKTDTYESSKSVGDDFIKGYFKDRGWLLGRDRAYDLCPACLTKPREAQQPRHATKFGITGRQRLRTLQVARPPQRTSGPETRLISWRATWASPKRSLRRSSAPSPCSPPRPPAPEAPLQAGSAPALSPEVEQALTGMAAELKGLRSTMELMAEQMGKLVALGSQQIEAIARLAPLMVQSAEGISGGFREVVRAIQSVPSASAPEREPTKAEKPLTRETEPVEQQDTDS